MNRGTRRAMLRAMKVGKVIVVNEDGSWTVDGHEMQKKDARGQFVGREE